MQRLYSVQFFQLLCRFENFENNKLGETFFKPTKFPKMSSNVTLLKSFRIHTVGKSLLFLHFQGTYVHPLID